ncbi:hypothetical protein ABEB36_011048 [Hypothenemus hampei]|uniref:Transposable element P transposase-like RNase H C-terminal domain-containing protein n=1 Tax=Hypothenemus hampei TaxID=57062 RepID=A0ABD1EEN2_HYPHA
MNFVIENGKLPATAQGTAEFALFFDNLFDSCNGISNFPLEGKPLRRTVTSETCHLEFWRKAQKILETLKFVDNKGKIVDVPSIRGWIQTIYGLRRIWLDLDKDLFKFLSPRYLNQDCIENFFGCIRNNLGRNRNLSADHFLRSFKTLLINNLTSPRSAGFNCENGQSDGLLTNLKEFFYFKDDLSPTYGLLNDDDPFQLLTSYRATNDFIAINITNYIAGFVAYRIYKITKSCEVCCLKLIGNNGSLRNRLITVRSYRPNLLKYPETNFAKLIEEIYFFAMKCWISFHIKT